MAASTTKEALDGMERFASLMRGGRPPDGTVRCWWCGTEPELVEITRLESAERELIAGKWPTRGGDHDHAVRQPTPGQLEQAGHEALMRIVRCADLSAHHSA